MAAYAGHVGLWLRPRLGCFGEESFKSRRGDIDEHTDRLICIIFKSRTEPRGVNAITRKHISPVTVKTIPAFDDIESFVFVVVVMRPRAAGRRSDIEKKP
jgi:hypothetical protein